MIPTSSRSGTAKSTLASSRPNDELAIVAVGGGSGLAALLRGLKAEVGGRLGSLSAVVTVSDDGGSSGRLRRDLGILPPGDIRNCLAALADDEDLLTRLFQYRFDGGEGLSGHSFGNLLLAALTGITGDFYQAILTAESILSVRGKILPATLTDVRLRAKGASGRVYEGESAVGLSAEPLVGLELSPAAVEAFPAAAEAILEADLVILGPGSLYTSILPNLLIPGIREALLHGPARVVLALNLMTQPGETDEMDAVDHVEAIERHAGPGLIDAVMLNTREVDTERLIPYEAAGARWVDVDLSAVEVDLFGRDLVSESGLVRHDPEKVRRAVLELAAAETAADPLPGGGA